MAILPRGQTGTITPTPSYTGIAGGRSPSSAPAYQGLQLPGNTDIYNNPVTGGQHVLRHTAAGTSNVMMNDPAQERELPDLGGFDPNAGWAGAQYGGISAPGASGGAPGRVPAMNVAEDTPAQAFTGLQDAFKESIKMGQQPQGFMLPGAIREGLGQRSFPNEASPLAMLRKIY